MSEENSSNEAPEEGGPEDTQLREHLVLVHALEIQSISELEDAIELSKGSEMEELYGEQIEQAREHEQLVTERLEARGHKPEAVKDLTMKAASEVGLRDLKDRPPDTPVKLAVQTFTVGHLEIAAYEFLARFANEAGDGETGEVAERVLQQKREMAEKVAERFERSVELTFEAAQSRESDESTEDGDERQDDSEEAEDQAEDEQSQG